MSVLARTRQLTKQLAAVPADVFRFQRKRRVGVVRHDAWRVVGMVGGVLPASLNAVQLSDS